MLRSITGYRPLLTALVAVASIVWGSAASAAPPVLTVPGPQTVSEGVRLTFQISATDADGQTVDLLAAGVPPGATFVDNRNNTGTFDWTPTTDQAGSYTVEFLADDTFGESDNESVAITVLDANSPPVLAPIGNRDVERGSTVFVSLNGTDDDGDPLTITGSGLPSYATLTDFGNGTGSMTLAPTASTPLGQSLVTVTLSDGFNQDSETFVITVTGGTAANPPVLAPIGNQTVAEGSVQNVALSASDADGNTMTWTVSLPGFASLIQGGSGAGTLTATLRMAPGFCQAGTYTGNVAVSDGGLQDSESFTITVTNVNRTPSWDQASYAASFVAGGETTILVHAFDPDEVCGLAAPVLSILSSDGGDALAASLQNTGGGAGSLHLSAPEGAQGTYHVTLKAYDGSLSRTVVVTVTVTEAPVLVQARAWSEADPLRLRTGKPRERFYLEPVNGTFAAADVVPSSIQLSSWGETGTVASIAPILETVEATHDRNQNEVPEVRMEFAKEDLRALFEYVNDRVAGAMILTATLNNGLTVTTAVNIEVLPERVVRIHKMGPNPLNPEAAVTIFLERSGLLRVRVYDVRGRLARTLIDGQSAPAGETIIRFDGKNDRGVTLPSGRYFVHAQRAEERDIKPITILK